MAPPNTNSQALISQQNQDDLLLSKTLHGYNFDEAHQQRDSFISKLHKKDKEFTRNTVDNYVQNWKEAQPEHETEADKVERAQAYKAVANSFYDLATDFYEVCILQLNALFRRCTCTRRTTRTFAHTHIHNTFLHLRFGTVAFVGM